MIINADKRLASICRWPFHGDHADENNVFYTLLCAYVSDASRLVRISIYIIET